MKCRYCGSLNVYRSHRKGIKEGLLLRLVFAAPFRCRDCRQRFIAFGGSGEFRRREKHSSLAAYLGLGSDASYKFERWLLIGIVGAVLLLVALVILRTTSG